jgi:hypothetical protein
MRNVMMTIVLAAAACGGLATGAGGAGSGGNSGDTTASLVGGTEDAQPAATAATYQDVEEYVNEHGDDAWQTWMGIIGTLRQDFDDICGDTFCEGDYSNLEPLRLRCSINPANGLLKNCTYVLAGSYEVVNASTGTIRTTAKTFSCHLPVTGIALADFEATLTAAGSTPPLQRPLPGKTTSIYDALGACL